MGQVPSAWNALPPLLHLANSYSSFKTQLERHLLQEAFPDFSAVDPFCLCAPLYSVPPSFVSATDMQSVVVTFESVTPRRL